ncbi:hypothetical protein ACLKA6_005356 [Drosophila palustris]
MAAAHSHHNANLLSSDISRRNPQDEYELIQKIGSGTYGDVYKCICICMSARALSRPLSAFPFWLLHSFLHLFAPHGSMALLSPSPVQLARLVASSRLALKPFLEYYTVCATPFSRITDISKCP